jgi:hypothetical protein
LPTEREDLLTLARLYGIQTSYHDALGRYVEAGEDSLLGVFRALQAPVESLDDVPEALRERREELTRRLIEPVIVAWDGHAPISTSKVASGGPRWWTSRAFPRSRRPKAQTGRDAGLRCLNPCRRAITISPSSWPATAPRPW